MSLRDQFTFPWALWTEQAHQEQQRAQGLRAMFLAEQEETAISASAIGRMLGGEATTGPTGGDSALSDNGPAAQGLANALNSPVADITLATLSVLGGPFGGVLSLGRNLALRALSDEGIVSTEGHLDSVVEGINLDQDVQAMVDAMEAAMGIGPGGSGVGPDGGGGGAAGGASSSGAAGGAGGPGTAGASGPGTGVGDASAATMHTGGPIRDRMAGDEMIRAQAGEFVVARGPARRYGALLKAINGGAPKRKVRRLALAMTGGS